MINEVIMRIDPTLADEFEKLDSTSAQFRQKNGELLVRLEKALYGCKESGRLWYKDVDFFSIQHWVSAES